jgi:hypothetical protein
MPRLKSRDLADIRAVESGRDQSNTFTFEPEARKPSGPAHVAPTDAGDQTLSRTAERRDLVDRSLNFAGCRRREIHQRAAIRQPPRKLMIGIIGGDGACRAALDKPDEDLPATALGGRERHDVSVR